MESLEIIITEELQGLRIDKAIAEGLSMSRSKVQKLFDAGMITINGKVISKKDCNSIIGDKIIVDIPEKAISTTNPAEIPLDIIFEDEHLIILNKQAGLTVHPGAGNHDDTLVNALMHHYGSDLSSLGGVDRPGIVHRLDRDTTGLMIVAKSDKAHEKLSKMLELKQIKRAYKALIWGVPNVLEDAIITNIDRARSDRKKMAACREPKGKRAVTHYKILQSWDKISLAECILETGRTHQIRVHMSHIGHSVLGDQTYGNNTRKILHNCSGGLKDYLENFQRQALHSYLLAFTHPITLKELRFESELPKDILTILDIL